MGLCFLLMGAGYRHQLVHIYPTFPDSGGKLWVAFFGILPTCMIIAEITIVSLLVLKAAAAALAMIFPLLVITMLFSMYINEQPFKMTKRLPSRECVATDLKNRGGR
jgi:hypothetical protein